MKSLVMVSFFTSFISLQALGKGQLNAIPLNSPVKETYLKVKLQGVDDISSVYFKPKNGGAESTGEILKEGTTFIGQLKVSSLKPGNYDYRVRVRTSSGSSVQYETASVAFISFAIDSSLEVPDPGEEGNKTLLGIDSDSDGIRDDVQRYLNETYSDQHKVRKALEQYAKASQNIFSTVSNKQENIQAIRKSLDAFSCLSGVEGSGSSAYLKLKQLEGKILSTKERLMANKKAELNFSGQSGQISKDKLSLCNFETK